MCEYDKDYARKYIEGTLHAPYTIYKNEVIADVSKNLGLQSVYDLGGNVSGVMNIEGSLRYQLSQRGIKYVGVDLSSVYFQRSFALSLGQTKEETFETVDGVVGDIRRLPIKSESLETVACADVIEHINHPEVALQEMHRVLKHHGKAIVVVPSLYKLDAIRVPHILQKRFSTHENRLLISEWVSLLSDAGFSVNTKSSRPLGIASGLLYLSWLNPDCVPTKSCAEDDEEFSSKALEFCEVKKIVAKADREIDNLVLRTGHGIQASRKMFEQGDILGLLKLVEHWYNETNKEPNETLHNFIESFDVGSVSLAGLDQLQSVMKGSSEAVQDDAFFGNSALLILEKV